MIQGSPEQPGRRRRTALSVPDPTGATVRPVGPTPRQVGTAQATPMVVDESGFRAVQALQGLFGAVGDAGRSMRTTALGVQTEEVQTAALAAQEAQRADLAVRAAEQQARIAEERAQEQVEREERAQQGEADAMREAPEDPAMAGFRSYSRAFGATRGAIDGSRAASEFAARVASGQVQDYERESRELLAAQTGALTGNPAYDAARLRAVRQGIDGQRATWTRQQVQNQQNEANNTLAADVARQVQEMNIGGESVEAAVQRFRAINPGRRAEAEAEILKIMANNARTPQQLAAVERAIREGVGGGRPLADRRPDLLPDFNRTVQQQIQQTSSREAEEGLRAISGKIDEAAVTLNPQQIQTLRQELDTFEQTRGAGAAVEAERNRLRQIEVRAAAQQAERQRYDDMMQGRALPDQELYNRGTQRMLDAAGIQPANPNRVDPNNPDSPEHWRVAAGIVRQGLRVGLDVPPAVLQALRAGLMSGGDGAVAAFKAIQEMTARQSPEVAIRVRDSLPANARAVFDALAANPGGDLVQAARDIRDRVVEAEGRPPVPLTTRTGTRTEAEAQAHVAGEVETAAWRIASGSWLGRRWDTISATADWVASWSWANPRGFLGTNEAGRRSSGVVVAEGVAARAQQMADEIHRLDLTGKSYSTALEEAMQALYSRGELDIVITPDGSRRMTLRPGGEGPIVDRLRRRPDGSAVEVPQIGPDVRNPYTHLREDTAATLEADRQAASLLFTGLTRGYTDDRGRLALNPSSSFRRERDGFIPMVNARNGVQIRLVPGQQFEIAGQRFTVGRTSEEIVRQFSQMAPGSEEIIRLTPVEYGARGTAYVVGLVPRWRHLSPESAAEEAGRAPTMTNATGAPMSAFDSLNPLNLDQLPERR